VALSLDNTTFIDVLSVQKLFNKRVYCEKQQTLAVVDN